MSNSRPSTRRIAWEGVSFQIPSTWEFAYHFGSRSKVRIRLEDDYSVRMKGEWKRFSTQPNIEKVRRNYNNFARPLRKEASASGTVEGLPRGWFAAKYQLKDGYRLLTGYYMPPDVPLIFIYQMQFGPEDPENPEQTVKALAESFQLHESGRIPWSAYDLDLEIPSEFRLLSTEFQAGSKHLVFQWRLRRLYLWQMSLAEIILRKHESAEDWAAQLLSNFKEIRGRRFEPVSKGVLAARKKISFPLGHYDEIGRWCFKYYARCAHDLESNKLFVWVFNYRSQGDLKHLNGSFGPYELHGREVREV